MQIKEKMEVFRKSAIKLAEQESRAVLKEYNLECNQELEKIKNEKRQEIERVFQEAEIKIKKKINRKTSEEIVSQKRLLAECQKEKKNKLFELVEKQLAEYLKTEEYEKYLIANIKKAEQLAETEELIVFINLTDIEKKQKLEQETGVNLTISQIEFRGGIRAVIYSKNILMDESFASKLEQERAAYTF